MRFLRHHGHSQASHGPPWSCCSTSTWPRGGLEVLGELKADPALRTIPVVVLTTSQAETDILRSYELHANAYVIKPFDATRFADAIRHIDDFFLTQTISYRGRRSKCGGGEESVWAWPRCWCLSR